MLDDHFPAARIEKFAYGRISKQLGAFRLAKYRGGDHRTRQHLLLSNFGIEEGFQIGYADRVDHA